ncbi:MAG: hypothetical protein IJ282_05185 [Lachnospiraceae bacterium]|nr:hypothetical protein [Lachnospiraceae bacterium]
MAKKCIKKFLGAFLAGILAVIAFVYVLDPFYHYHGPWLGMDVYLYNAVYQTAGAAKNLEYDSVLMGTSMTENFRTSWFDEELGWDTVKLSYSGARTNDLSAIFKQIYSSDNEIKNIFIDINGYQLTVEPETALVVRPEYLYDDNLFNDVNYVFNKDIITAGAGRLLAHMMGKEGNMDTAYSWGETSRFGKEVVFDVMRESRENPVPTTVFLEDMEHVMEMCNENLDNVGKVIKAHPETTFYIFYPPYSILYWEELIYSGKIDGMHEVYKTSMEYFLQFPNVKLYSFQNEREIITNLDIYLDSCHHTPEINRYIFECIRDGKNQITTENYEEELTQIFEYARNFDYEAVWAEDVR